VCDRQKNKERNMLQFK